MTAALRNGRLVVTGDLNFDERREFMVATQSTINLGDPVVLLDCTAVDVIGPVDDAVIGMLVTLVRAAQNRGARLALVHAPKLMRAQVEATGVAHFFDWRG